MGPSERIAYVVFRFGSATPLSWEIASERGIRLQGFKIFCFFA